MVIIGHKVGEIIIIFVEFIDVTHKIVNNEAIIVFGKSQGICFKINGHRV